MSLLHDVWLIDSEVLVPPTASTFECSITKLASLIWTQWFLKKSSVIVHGSKIGSHHWKEKQQTFLARLASKSRSRVWPRLSGTSQCWQEGSVCFLTRLRGIGLQQLDIETRHMKWFAIGIGRTVASSGSCHLASSPGHSHVLSHALKKIGETGDEASCH